MILKLQFEIRLEIVHDLSHFDKIFLLKNQKQITIDALLFIWHWQ